MRPLKGWLPEEAKLMVMILNDCVCECVRVIDLWEAASRMDIMPHFRSPALKEAKSLSGLCDNGLVGLISSPAQFAFLSDMCHSKWRTDTHKES